MVDWRKLETAPGVIDQELATELQALMDDASQCRIKVILDLLGTPKWDSMESPLDQKFGAYPGRSGPDEYGWMASRILERWPGLYALEVWNEPNLQTYWVGTPREYAALVNAAVDAKHRLGSQTLILGGALAYGDARYLQQLYAAGMRGQDGISIHPYSLRDRFVDPGAPHGPFRAGIKTVHHVMLANGDTSGMWLTEFGFATCPAQPICVPEDVQAAWMAKSLRIAACYPFIEGVTAFVLRNAPVPPAWDETSWTLHFGMMNPDFSPKPAFGSVQSTFGQLAQMERAQRARKARKHRRQSKKRHARANAASIASSPMCRRLLGVSATKAQKHAKRTRRRSHRARAKSTRLRNRSG
jgi:hypothetical protein